MTKRQAICWRYCSIAIPRFLTQLDSHSKQKHLPLVTRSLHTPLVMAQDYAMERNVRRRQRETSPMANHTTQGTATLRSTGLAITHPLNTVKICIGRRASEIFVQAAQHTNPRSEAHDNESHQNIAVHRTQYSNVGAKVVFHSQVGADECEYCKITLFFAWTSCGALVSPAVSDLHSLVGYMLAKLMQGHHSVAAAPQTRPIDPIQYSRGGRQCSAI